MLLPKIPLWAFPTTGKAQKNPAIIVRRLVSLGRAREGDFFFERNPPPANRWIRGRSIDMKLWAGRMTGQVDEKLNELNASIGFDSRMYRQDIAGSIAHATMLGEVGVVTPEESAQIVEGLKGILAEIDSGALEIDMSCEDIHTFVEAELTKRIGAAGTKLPAWAIAARVATWRM